MAKHKTSPLTAGRTGMLSLALQAHAPYVRQAGPSGAGEEGLHGLIAETYVPLLAGLYDLLENGIHVRLGLALSPLLLEQLADPVVQKHTLQALDAAVDHANERVQYHQSQHDDHAAYVAQFYHQLHRRTLHMFERKWGRNIVAATRSLAEAGVIEVLAQTATNIVPQIHDATTLRVQLEIGLISIMQHLGQRPSVLWMGGEPLPRALADILPPLGIDGIIGAPGQPRPDGEPQGSGPGAATWFDADRSIWVLTPDQRLTTHVRSTTFGYPGDALYRASGQRVRGASAGPLGDGTLSRNGKPYDPFYAYARARLHARHFLATLDDMVYAQAAPAPLVLGAEMELFGSGWFEGGMWLRTVLEELAHSPTLELRSPSTVVDHFPPADGSAHAAPSPAAPSPPDGRMAEAARQLRAAAASYPRAYGDRERTLNQAARELLLAQSGDWDRWQGTAAGEYANERRALHLARMEQLLELARDEMLLPIAARQFAELSEQDNPFASLNYRLFGPHEER